MCARGEDLAYVYCSLLNAVSSFAGVQCCMCIWRCMGLMKVELSTPPPPIAMEQISVNIIVPHSLPAPILVPRVVMPPYKYLEECAYYLHWQGWAVSSTVSLRLLKKWCCQQLKRFYGVYVGTLPILLMLKALCTSLTICAPLIPLLRPVN